jgi:hypothetical protein
VLELPAAHMPEEAQQSPEEEVEAEEGRLAGQTPEEAPRPPPGGRISDKILNHQ